ncbi:MAG: DNA topoisomerase [Sideroxydans sp.]|nr:DNA topoisomerase [Sideroxydans sp.]MDD5056689.1 DNA topoisomerase [Sideroxydans sp.]
MRLFIASSHVLARDIARALPGIQESADEYFSVGNDVVTWCDGRLLQLCDPDYYDSRWAKWDASTLPIRIPYDKWQLTPELDKTSKSINPVVKKQLATIEAFLRKATIVVNASGARHIFIDEVIDYFGYLGKVMRLHLNINSVISANVIEDSMQDNFKFRNAFLSEVCRSRANWLVGHNLSRAVTKLLARDRLISIGRIQTPMLALLVQRCIEVEKREASPRNAYFTAHTLIHEMQLFARCGISDITTLKNRGFIETKGDQIKDTQLGRSLIQVLPEKLKDLAVTAAWENALEQVASGNYSPEDFMWRLDIFIQNRLDEIRALAGRVTIASQPELQSHQKTMSGQHVRTTNISAASMRGQHVAKPSC